MHQATVLFIVKFAKKAVSKNVTKNSRNVGQKTAIHCMNLRKYKLETYFIDTDSDKKIE